DLIVIGSDSLDLKIYTIEFRADFRRPRRSQAQRGGQILWYLLRDQLKLVAISPSDLALAATFFVTVEDPRRRNSSAIRKLCSPIMSGDRERARGNLCGLGWLSRSRRGTLLRAFFRRRGWRLLLGFLFLFLRGLVDLNRLFDRRPWRHVPRDERPRHQHE